MVLVNFSDRYFIKLARWKTGNAITYFGLIYEILQIPKTTRIEILRK